jgi:hypothetical protein
MGIIYGTKVLPKAGRLAAGSYSPVAPIPGDPFGRAGDAVPDGTPGRMTPGFHVTPQTLTDSQAHPMGTFRNVATQDYYYPAFPTAPGQQQNPLSRRTGENDSTPSIQPHEKGRFFGTKERTIVRQTGGVKKSMDTAFHPKPGQTTANRPVRKSPMDGERTTEASFPSTVRLLGDPQWSAHGGAARWATVKRGAAG